MSNISIEQEIKKSYLEYSLSVIIGRAIPDVRDGLKPVHRRILYAMHELGNTYNRPYKKSARVVGDVIGKYHPHGDSAVYDALVRMAQDFNMRDPLVDGQGNFGSIDGDAPAAMRYTEARMSRLAGEFLADIEKNTVNFRANYDNTLTEPEVLPARVPNILVNGSSGIAVGMATNIPPHNLGEVIDALLQLLDNPETNISQLMQHIKAPDLPTGAYIYNLKGVLEAYRTGRGSFKIRSRLDVETRSRGHESIVINEVPYALNKANLVEKIAGLVNDKKIEGISDLRDESDRNGIRIVIDLKKGAISDVIINKLYKLTALETSFGINMMAVVNNRPQLLNLKQVLEYFLEHRKEVILRRSRHDLEKAEHRAHILEGLQIALDNIDEVVRLIRSSSTGAEAREKLMSNFSLSQVQAQAILDMRLQRLTNMEREKLMQEYRELLQQIEFLKSILENIDILKGEIKKELQEIKKTYSTPRRTQILEQDPDSIEMLDLIPDHDVVVTLSRNGYIKRTLLEYYHQQKRGGKGIAGANVGDKDFITTLFTTSNHKDIYLFSNTGKSYLLKAYEIPEGSRTARGVHIKNLLPLDNEEYIATALSERNFHQRHYFLFVTKKGMVKKTSIEMFKNMRSLGLIAVNLKPGDELIGVKVVKDESEVIITTHDGLAIRFACRDLRAMGRNAAGVKGISLRQGDEVVSGAVLDPGEARELFTISEKGFGKKTSLDMYKLQARGGKGLINMKVTSKTGKVVSSMPVSDQEELIIFTSANKIIRLGTSDIRSVGRSTQGVKMVDLENDQKVICADLIIPEQHLLGDKEEQ
ncbi:DNA gyrase subunit A [Desulfonatronospira sp. MSAO_Bac3]|uniref:DNA gyrase subunit A n=1 Tax=Desulfonatronospira sp. MSAO_Bac3 TaxID=2293857 RepID=UPI000FF6DF64|nr:DNA gyrase subunit A [Desulfonatronospira sp. MSAO_Bac3]RQD75144.1 MAG: DNA gyrase subunit A [Desulfonatronospira sp. MSAO_Bac3]